jgi:hypothetical protein
MKSEDQMRRAYESMGRTPWWNFGAGFKAGMFVGKLLALGWALDEASGAYLAVHFSFDDWLQQQKRLSAAEALNEMMSIAEPGAAQLAAMREKYRRFKIICAERGLTGREVIFAMLDQAEAASGEHNAALRRLVERFEIEADAEG